MESTGKAHEGWMAMIPLVVLVFLVIIMLGGPIAVINDVALWASDAATAVGGWLKSL
jgi:hypothetical protein